MKIRYVFLAAVLMNAVLFAPGFSLETPVPVFNGNIDTGQESSGRIVRTATGRLYYFSGNSSSSGDGTGWVDVQTSADGQSWTKVDSSMEYQPGGAISVAIDAANVIHMITYDNGGHPSYQRFNSADSAKGDHRWERIELIDGTGTVPKGRCALAIDANDTPHLLYQLKETYKWKNKTTLIYANHIGGAWNITALWSMSSGRRFSGSLEIAIGPDNLPHILLGSKMLRGNANNPDFFETKELGEAYSFAIHQNGDVRVALSSKGHYANQIHDHTQPWERGWTLTESAMPDRVGVLVLAEDKPWLITQEPDGLHVQREFEPSRLAVAQPAGHAWKYLTARWSYYNNHSPWMIDMAASSWDAALGSGYWYGRHITRTVADFSVVPVTGPAPLSVMFSNSSLAADGQIITLNQWDFENRGMVDSTEANPIHVYDNPGSYSARLTVTDSAGVTDTKVMKDLNVADSNGASIPTLAAGSGSLKVSTSSLPAGAVGVAYSQTLSATGGATPYTWSKTGGSLPAGLALNSSGVISGAPTTAGSSSFTVQVKDKNNKTATKSLSITITAPLVIATTSLADGYLTTSYKQTLTATGGKTAYSWSVTSGTLPAGLSLAASTGVISGTPAVAGSSNITIQVKDANKTTVSKSLSIVVYRLPSIATSSLPAGTVGVAYSQTLESSGGRAPTSWSISNGSLPAGLSLNTSTGTISGTPTTNGSSTITFKVTDVNTKTATKTISIIINATPPSITTTSLADGYFGVSYSQTLTASGGKMPYSWSIISGALPAGLSLAASTGVISGSPTATGKNNVTFQVKDGNNAMATAVLPISIIAGISITDRSLPIGVVGLAYSRQLTATGGKPPYSWSYTYAWAGPFQIPGLSLNPATGEITGIPTTPGGYHVDIIVTDTNNTSAISTVFMDIYEPVTITTTSLHSSYIGIPYKRVLEATGGLSPFTWVVSNGSLPAGLTLDSATGAISGVPTIPGTAEFTIRVHDSNSVAATKHFNITINGYGSIGGVITDQSNGNPVQGATVLLNLAYKESYNADDRSYSCGGTAFTSADYAKVDQKDEIKYRCDGHVTSYFKIRNPFGVTDPFSVHWNGLSAYTGNEFLAQSFKPTRNGSLNKVRLYYSGYGAYYLPSQGEVYILLKSSLGGNRGVYLAHSTTLSVFENTPVGWQDFDFATPVSVTAGQEYVIELQGYFPAWNTFQGNTYYDFSRWGNGVAYAGGNSYLRTGGIWGKLDTSLAFMTYIDGSQDTVTDLPSQNITIHGTASYAPELCVTNVAHGTDEPFTIDYANNPEFYPCNNSADFNGSKSVTNGNEYYDSNGWITVSGWSSSGESSAIRLVTDQFDIIYNRVLRAVTDSNGVFSFPSLPEGSYVITVTKTGYISDTTNGNLAPGQTLTVNRSVAWMSYAILQGTVKSTAGETLGEVTVTVNDPAGARTATSDSNGNYLVSGIASGDYSVTFSAPLLQSKTLTGHLEQAQTSRLDVTLTPLPINLRVSSPDNLSVVSTNPVTITGRAANADYVKITVANGSIDEYLEIVVDGVFAVPVLLNPGTTWIYAQARNRYGVCAETQLYVSLAPFTFRVLGDSGNIALVEGTGSFDAILSDGSTNNQPRQAIAREYIKAHGDTFDFLVFLSTFDYTLPEAGAEGFYLSIKNDIQGINQPIFDNSDQFGSSGRLQGTIDRGNVSALAAVPYGPLLDTTTRVLNHELMHRFGAYVRYKNLDGSLNSALLGKDSAHWSYQLDSQGSIMYGNGWRNNGDGTFTATSARSGYSPLDLYLMGMIPKEQVPPMLLIDNPSIDRTQLPQPGATISGAAKTVTVDDIIAAEGERVPDSATSPKKFNVGFVLLTRADDNTTAATQAIEILRRAWAGRFAELTRGVGGINGVAPSVSVVIDSPTDGATITGPAATVTGSVINSSGAETGVTVNGIPAAVASSRFIANHVPLQEGANTITVTATDVNGLTATATRSVTAQTGNYIRISSTIDSGVAPLDLTLRLNGSFTITNPTMTTSGPTAVTLTPGESATEFTTRLSVEGTYTITASVVGPDGKTYADSVTITVINRTQLESLLKAKWEGMKTKVTAMDVEGTVSYFISPLQQDFREMFTAAGASLPSLSSYMAPISLEYVTDNIAKCRMTRNELVAGQSQEVEYVVYFVKENGIWKLQDF